MAKSISSPIVVETKIGKLKFVQKPNGNIVVRCKGKERIRIRQARDGKTFEADAKEFNSVGAETIAIGRTAEKCYKNALKSFWL